GEEMPGAVPLPARARLPARGRNEPHKGFVNQRRRLQRLPRTFPRQLPGGQAAQLVVDQRQDSRGGVLIVRTDGVQKTRDLAHVSQDNRTLERGQTAPVPRPDSLAPPVAWLQ